MTRKPSEPSRRVVLQASAAAGIALLGRQARPAENKEVSWLSEIQQSPVKLPPDAPQLSELLVGADGQRIATVDSWNKRREEFRRWWLEFLGPLPAERKTSPPSLTIVEEDRTDGVIRQLVRYEIEPGIETEAYLLKPEKLTGKAPGIVAFHSTVNYTIRQPAGLEGPPEKFFGLRYAKQGCVCFCPRNYLWPKTSNERIATTSEVNKLAERAPSSKGMAKMLYDALVAVDILAAQPEVDATRLGAVGHSLGAKEALYIAAFDERIRATVSSEGGIGTKFSNWEAPWYLGPSIKEPTFTHEHHELLALVAPRAFLLVGGRPHEGPIDRSAVDGDRGWPFITSALPVYELFGKPARLGQFLHGKGHAVPPEAEQRIEEWLLTYL
jgi:dienelactone hydrolase